MGSLPYLSTKGFRVWLAGHSSHRAHALELFEQLAGGIATQSGREGNWALIRDIATGRRRGTAR